MTNIDIDNNIYNDNDINNNINNDINDNVNNDINDNNDNNDNVNIFYLKYFYYYFYNILKYENRINGLDNFLSIFSNNNFYKFIILITLHYPVLSIFYLILLFTNNIFIYIIIYFFIILQVILNYYDNGCYFMKLERRYIGKWWFGPYLLLNLFKKDFINSYNTNSSNSCFNIFKLISYTTLILGFIKLIYFFI